MEDWQRKIADDKMRDRASRNTSKELLATYSGTAGIKDDDLKLKLMRDEHRKKQREAKLAMAKYKKKELSEDDVKLRALREEQRRLQEDAERAMHDYKKTELSEDDIKLRALREEDRKKQQDAEKMWRTFQNNDVKTKKRAVRQDVTHPPVESHDADDSLANITAGSVSELASALKHASPPRKLESPRRRSQRPGSGTLTSHSYDEGGEEDEDDNDYSASSGLVADPCDSPRRGAVAAAAAHFSGLSTSGLDYPDYSERSNNTDNNSRSADAGAGAATTDQSTEHSDYDFSAHQDETDAKEDDEEPPSDSQPVVEESEQEPFEKPVEEEPAVVVSTEQPVESTEEAEPVASEIADEIEVSEQPVKEEEPVIVAENEEPVESAVVEKEEEPVVEPEPIDEPAVVKKEEIVEEAAAKEPVVAEEEPVVSQEPTVTVVKAPVVEEEPVKTTEPTTPPVVAEEEPAKEPEAPEKVEAEEVASKPAVEKERAKKKSKNVPLQPAAYTQPSEDSKVVKREQYIDAQSGEEKKLEVNDDILHVLDDAEETKPLVGQTSKVRLDVLFSFGLLTTSKKPSFSNYLMAVEDIVERMLIDKPDVAKYVSYDKDFGPFVQEYNKDDTYVDPKGRDHVRRVVVIAAIPVFLSNGISIRTARESICAGLQGAIVSGEFVYLAKTTFNQKKQKA